MLVEKHVSRNVPMFPKLTRLRKVPNWTFPSPSIWNEPFNSPQRSVWYLCPHVFAHICASLPEPFWMVWSEQKFCSFLFLSVSIFLHGLDDTTLRGTHLGYAYRRLFRSFYHLARARSARSLNFMCSLLFRNETENSMPNNNNTIAKFFRDMTVELTFFATYPHPTTMFFYCSLGSSLLVGRWMDGCSRGHLSIYVPSIPSFSIWLVEDFARFFASL